MRYDRNHIVRMWALILQVGITAIAPVVLCVGAGLIIKDKWGIDWMLFLSILGIVSGFVAAFRMAAHQAGTDDEATRIVTGMYDKKRPSYEAEEDNLEELLKEKYERLNSEREDF